MSDRSLRKQQQTRDHLAQTAIRLFEQSGYDATTMDQISTAADVARGTLYNHFADKDAIVAYWVDTQLAQGIPLLLHHVMTLSSFQERLTGIFQASAQWWQSHWVYIAPYLRHRFQQVQSDDAASGSDMLAVYERLIADAQDALEISATTPAPQLARYLHFLYLSAVMHALGNADVSLPDELKQAAAFFLAGCRAPSALPPHADPPARRRPSKTKA
ncbi:TetR/AcrR family transcriptional regulator [Achromobacter marplatensis]|uniref:TetR/AcrR family transcriptional regulator n=1 Tax=Achromobacter marplatensis TaxID=470868 RepID=UPI0039F662E9